MAKKLKKDEFFDLESQHVSKELLDKDKEILELKIELFKSRKSILKYMIKELDVDCVRMDKELKDFDKKYEVDSKKRNEILDRIRDRLKLLGRFGYNSDTLEIIE